ncbi:MAG: Lon protease family protein [Ignavibacteriales bacterium]
MLEIEPARLRAACDPGEIGCETTEGLEPLENVVGQDRALQALELGLAVESEGFNIFVAGEAGTGRATAVNEYLSRVAKAKPAPSDWCLAFNFRDSYQPKAIRLAAGEGVRLAREVTALVEAARREVPKAFESEQYARSREEILQGLSKRRDEILADLNAGAQAQGFAIQSTPMGVLLSPVFQGRPLSDQEYAALPAAVRDAVSDKRQKVEAEIMQAMREIRRLEKDAARAVEDLDRRTVMSATDQHFERLKEEFKDTLDVLAHLDEMRQDMLDHAGVLRKSGDAAPREASSPAPSCPSDLHFRRYAINVIVDNTGAGGAPVVLESNPTYANLFGRIEKEVQDGVLVTDLSLVRGGALHRANGGYLVLPVEDLLRNPMAYDSLKRALRRREIVIEDAGDRMGLMATKSLRPQPIPLDVKVIVIGTPVIYQQLYLLDQDFSELFKIKAEFDTTMERTPDNVRTYASFLCKLCKKENLKHLDAGAAAKIVEHSSRLAGDQAKLSTHFAVVADIIREASFYAARDRAKHVGATHISRAIEAKTYRSNLIESRIREMTARGILKIETTGSSVGEVNGLAVIDLGDISFGKPSRITASVGLGRDGIVDIEREAKLGGRLHSKGVLILGGFLIDRYGQNNPISLSARLVFEQNYEMIDGDSASSAELYALLSALSGLPVRRGLAVTGSVNQRGEVQAIGGVNEKIEGVFEVCKMKGLTGDQGVIIPEANVKHLMLKEQVVETAREGGFHIYGVSTIDQGIELLTGVPAGGRREDGSFPEGTVNHLVQKRLRELAEKIRGFGVAPSHARDAGVGSE